MDRDERFQFAGQTSLFSEASTPERDALIKASDRRTLHSIISTAPLEGADRVHLRKPSFLFGDVAHDLYEHLNVGEEEWIFKIEDGKYFHPS